MTPSDMLTVAFGMVIGFSLGLTGGGDSIFAVPILVYGLGTGAREAVAISLAAVGATSLLGAARRFVGVQRNWNCAAGSSSRS